MTRKYLLTVLIASFLALTGCAEHTHDREDYVDKEGNIFRMDDFKIWLEIYGTRTDLDKNVRSSIRFLWTDTSVKDGFPYTLHVVSRYSGETKDTTKIL